MSSFQMLEGINVNSSYDFNDVVLATHNNERHIRYLCTSWFKICKSISVEELKSEVIKIKIKGCKKEKMNCIECLSEISIDNIDDVIYTCEKCGLSALLPEVTYNVTALFMGSNTTKSLSLSSEMLSSVGSLKLLLTETFSVSLRDSTITKIEIVKS